MIREKRAVQFSCGASRLEESSEFVAEKGQSKETVIAAQLNTKFVDKRPTLAD
jgi:hypothetical protein